MSIKAIASDARGNVGLLFGLMAPVLIASVGVGIDYSRAAAARTDLQQATTAITQQITTEINQCLDRQRTLQTGAIQSDLDRQCLNDTAFISQLIQRAQPLLIASYHQRGHSSAPIIVGTPFLDRASGVYRVSAAVTYPCYTMRALGSSCSVDVGLGSTATDAFAQANVLTVNGPEEIEIWSGQSGGGLPAQFTATGGWPDYQWMMAGVPLPGVSIDVNGGIVSGTLSGTSCTAPCDVQYMGIMQIGAMDAGDPNRERINRQTAVTGTKIYLVHPLQLQFELAGSGRPRVEQFGTAGPPVAQPDGGTSVSQPNLLPPFGMRGSGTNPPGVWLRLQLARSGGKSPYSYQASLPQGYFLEPSTGEVLINTYYIRNAPSSVTIGGSVSDGRGLSANASTALNFNGGGSSDWNR